MAVIGQEVRGANLVFRALHVGDCASGFFDEKNTGGEVPGAKADLPEAVETTAGHVREVDCRGTAATHPVGGLGEFVKEVDVRVDGAVVVREARGEEAVGYAGSL